MSNPKGINQYTKNAGNRKALTTMHTGARQEFSKMGKFNISADTSKSARKETANQIRRLRNMESGYGGMHSRITMHAAVSEAAASTRLRNIARMASKKK